MTANDSSHAVWQISGGPTSRAYAEVFGPITAPDLSPARGPEPAPGVTTMTLRLVGTVPREVWTVSGRRSCRSFGRGGL